jgi:hypothetical protein
MAAARPGRVRERVMETVWLCLSAVVIFIGGCGVGISVVMLFRSR